MTSSLSKYVGNAQLHVEELRRSLTEDDLIALRAELVSLGVRGWLKWRFDNQNLIEEYLRATPTARNRHKSWQDQSLRLRLTCAAILYALDSQNVLSVLHESSWIETSSFVGYRDMTASAADILYRIQDLQYGYDQWPFPDIETPFPL
jgi:hypothetical protein